jgi:hypothetical protein
MQEEITKHTKKAFKTLKNDNYTMREKLKEIALEIFIIVFAVTLSISLHSWSEKRHQREEAKEFLLDMKKDLAIDKKKLEDAKNNIDEGLAEYKYLIGITKKKLDSLHEEISMSYRTQRFNSLIGNYEGFKSSGKLGYIENKKLKTKILNFYQQILPEINYSQKLYQDNQDFIANQVIFNDELVTEKIFFSPGTKKRLRMLLAISMSVSEKYQDALIQINEITSEINNEYKE